MCIRDRLNDADRHAIAVFLKAIPAVTVERGG